MCKGVLNTTLLIGFIFVSGCVNTPPRNTNNICKIFKQKKSWHADAVDMEKRWSVPIAVPMAIIYQESSFIANAKPARNYVLFGLIPWGRKSSAYGFSQAIDGTWDKYITETKNYGADRDDFTDAIDFVGWYVNTTRRKNQIKATDGYHQYLNYHEGWLGYRQGSYNNKKWLMDIARRVDRQSREYSNQYESCKKELSQGFWYRLLH